MRRKGSAIKFINSTLICLFLTSIPGSSSVAFASNPVERPFFSQQNSEWANDVMGLSSCTIKDCGCAMVDTAMLLNYYGIDTNPKILNTWLSNNDGFTTDDLIKWEKLDDYSNEYGNGEMRYVDFLKWTSDPPYNDNDHWNDLYNQVDQGYPVIVKVDANLDTPDLESHWVLVTFFMEGAIDNPSNYYINDPWDLSFNPDKTLQNYWDSTYDNTFFAIRVYHGEKFNIGDTVQTTTNLNVRTQPDVDSNEIIDPDYPGSAAAGTVGEVLDGPTGADCYLWWKIDYGPGLYTGWSVQDYLEKGTPCPHSCWDREPLSDDELANIVRSNFPLGVVTQTGESKRVTAYAIARAESGGNPSACGDNDKSIGLWQINIDYHPEYDRCHLFEANYNANAANEASNNGENWNPWCTWEQTACDGNGNESYKQYLTEARKHFYPKVTSLSVSQTSIDIGEAVNIYYSVSDDVGLDRVELWRTSDENGSPDESNWQEIKRTTISGTEYSDSFNDFPDSPGIYWYGIHIIDNSGAPEAWNDERNSRTGGLPGVFGPIQVEVTEPNLPPQLSDPSVQPAIGTPSTDFYYYVTYFDPDGDSPNVKQVYIDGTAYTMDWYQGLNSHITYRFGPENLSVGANHYYFFYFEDGRGGSIRLPSGTDMYLGPTVSESNNPPNTPSGSSPSNQATGISINAGLSWSGGDPDAGDTVTYDVYFGTGSSPPLVSDDQTGTTYDPGTLNHDTEYYWKVIATDNHGASTQGPLWEFTTASSEVVTFPDPNLEAAIRDALGKPTGDIYQSELEGLTSLDGDTRNISDITGLEYCMNLTQLLLLGNQISDISPLQNLSSLTGLSLGHNQISDISPLQNLSSLTGLSLGHNQISDISPLQNLTGLTELDLDRNQITDISPLQNLTSLTDLDLGVNQISDISPLVANYGIDSGDYVYLRGNPLSVVSLDIYIPQLEGRGVEVVYDAVPNDTTPPTVSSTSPGDGDTDVLIDTVVIATFSEPMDSSTITTNSFTLAGSAVSGTITYDSNAYTATFTPDANLNYNHEYTATLSTDITDLAGNPLAEPYSWSFTTATISTLVHNVDTGEDFQSIQAAIDDADTQDGHTIIVEDGTYNENVDVNKSLTIQSENGADTTIVQAASPDDHVFEIEAAHVRISGFTIRGATGNDKAGIYLNNTNRCKISDNIVQNNYEGISLKESNDAEITRNTTDLNSDNGIELDYSRNNRIMSNIANNNGNDYGGSGIFVLHSDGNIFGDNTANSNTWNNIDLKYSSNNTLMNNTASNSDHNGIIIHSSSNNNTLRDNKATNNGYGIVVQTSSKNNTLTRNTALSNKNGIYVYESENNFIYMNTLIDNTRSVYSAKSTNTWNSPEQITYTYNGDPYTNYLGNYSSDYTGSDTDGDGIGDIPYAIDSDQDNYPLMEPFENYETQSDTIPPATVADLSIREVTANSVTLGWTAPGDDSNQGTASHYDIRYSTSEITEANWDSATQCTGEPTPQPTGSSENFTITGLAPGTTYYFAMKTGDEVPNWSGVSNVVSCLTEDELTALIEVDRTSVRSGDLVTFNGSNSTGPIASYKWNFGDGRIVEGSGHPGTQTHRFRGAMEGDKEYVVELMVVDNSGATHSATVSVTVRPLEKILPIGYPSTLPGMEASIKAKFTYNWVDTRSGEDVYVLHGIHWTHSNFTGISGLFVGIKEETLGGYTHKVIWWDALLSHTEEKVYVPPLSTSMPQFLSRLLYGERWDPHLPVSKLYGEEFFEGLEVYESYVMHMWSYGTPPEADIGTEPGVVLLKALIKLLPIIAMKGTSAFFKPEPAELDWSPRIDDIGLAALCSPAQLAVYDSQGRVTGLADGEIKQEIPNSAYLDGFVLISSPFDSYYYKVVGIDEGTYGLKIAFLESGEATIFAATDIGTSANATHQYTVDWVALGQGQSGVTVKKDSDGDGTFEETITTTPPYTPSSPSPSSGATGVSISTALGWTGGDPDQGDNVTYKIYLGTSGNPPLVSNNLTGNTYDPSTLDYDTTYYWRVVARDNHGITTEGPIWTFTAASPSAPTGGGGGGGGGGAVCGLIGLAGYTTMEGKLIEDITGMSCDEMVTVFLPKGTMPKNRLGSRLTSIRIEEEEEPPAPPTDSACIGLVYNIEPDGATLDPPITLTIRYDAALIPEGVSEENLFIALWDESKSEWVKVDCIVNTEENTITTKISHFSIYTVMASTRPAEFSITDLSVIPDEIESGEDISISVLITNTGDLTGNYEVSLKIDDVVAQTKEVTLAGGDSETVSFSVTPDTVAEHTASIGDLLGTFKVKALEAPPAPAPAVVLIPASFAISDLSITPREVKPAEQVKISAVVTNTGGSEGSYTVVLKIDDTEEARKEVTLGVGKSETVTFTIAKGIEGSYTVNVDGKVGQFTVIVPSLKTTPVEALPVQPTTNWGLIGSIIVGCVVAAGLLVYFLWWRKRGALRPS